MIPIRFSTGSRWRVAALSLALAVAAACASAPILDRSIQVSQGVQIALGALDDAERTLCYGSTVAPDVNPSRCTTEAASVAGLTDARHDAIGRIFVKAYDAQEAIVAVLKAGGVADFSNLDAAAAELDAQLSRIVGRELPPVASLLAKALQWRQEIEAFKRLIGKDGDPWA